MSGIWRKESRKRGISMKALRLLLAFVCGFMACFSWAMFQEAGIEPQVDKAVPSIAEIQKMVGAEPDGIMGQETLRKWDEVICEQFAGRSNHYYEEVRVLEAK